MKDLGVADIVLNIKLLRDDDGGITLLQSHYVDKILSRFGYSDCKSSPTPYDPSVLLRKNRGTVRGQLTYSKKLARLCTWLALQGLTSRLLLASSVDLFQILE